MELKARALPQFNWKSISWGLLALAAIRGVNHNLTIFLFTLSSEGPVTNRGIMGVTSALSLLLDGWLLFFVFLPPNSKGLRAPSELTNRQLAKITGATIYILLCQFVLNEFALRLISLPSAPPKLTVLADATLLGLALMIAVALSIAFYRSRPKKPSTIVHSSIHSLRTAASEKIEDHLSEKDKDELAKLLYQLSAIDRLSVQSLAWAFWVGLLIPLVKEILEQLIAVLFH